MPGVATAVPTQPIYLVASTYGHVTVAPNPSGQPGNWVDARSRVWVTIPTTSPDGMRSPEVTLAHNDNTGHAVYVPFIDGRIATMTIRRGSWEIRGRAGWRLTASVAPCVCGAGQVGHAPITRARHHIVAVRSDMPEMLEWLTQVP